MTVPVAADNEAFCKGDAPLHSSTFDHDWLRLRHAVILGQRELLDHCLGIQHRLFLTLPNSGSAVGIERRRLAAPFRAEPAF